MPDSPANPLEADVIGTLYPVLLHRLNPDSQQPRRDFDEEALQQLADSIRAMGVLQPIVVRPKIMGEIGEGDYDYTIVSGERRWRAAKLAGLDSIPAIVRVDLCVDRNTVAVLQLVENLQRADLTLWETARGCRALVDAIGLETAAQQLGYSKPWVSQRATVCALPEAISSLIERGLLSDVETAHNLAALAEIDEQSADTVDGWLEDIANGLPPTREDVRQELRDARQAAEDAAALQRRLQAKADDEALKRATPDSFELTPPDDEDDDAPAPKPASTPRITENSYQREHRLREEAWAELMPDCRKLAREARKQTLTKLGELVPTLAEGSHKFSLTIGGPQTGSEVPAKAAGAHYMAEIDGGSGDAGVLLEALDTKHEITINTRVTVAQLRAVERLLNKTFRVSTAVQARGTVLNDIQQRLATAHSAMEAAAAEHAADVAAIANGRMAATPQASAAAAADEAQAGEGGVAEFLRACTQRAPGLRIKASDLYAAYCAWCQRHGRTAIRLTDNRWGEAIVAAGIERKRSNGWQYVGILLLIAADDA